MSHFLPQEILDLIIDHLHDEPATLKACCLVSKSWVQCAQKHLFAYIKLEFSTITGSIHQWRETFLDPTNSLARNTRTLSLRFPEFITTTDVDTLLTFRNVIRLNVETYSWLDHQSPLVPLHGIFTAIKSLCLRSTTLSSSEVFELVCSLPLIEDLTLITHVYQPLETWTRPSTSPRLRGTLELCVTGGIESITDRLLDLPNGLHSKRIVVSLFTLGDVRPAMDLVSRCSDTLKCLGVKNIVSGAFHPTLALSRKLIFAQMRHPQSTSPEQLSLGL
jgi:hypothetical protein